MLVRGVIGRLLSATGVLALAATVTIGLAPRPAEAVGAAASVPVSASLGRTATVAPAPKAPPGPTAVQITGKFPAQSLTIRAQDAPDLFRALLGQVSWLADASPQMPQPAAKKLGPKFTVVVLTKAGPQQTYDLYPLATGGPRAYRPVKQPNGQKTTEGWFYGQLTMSEALRVSGVPLPAHADEISGGIGGGETLERTVTDHQLDPGAGMTAFVDEMRQLVLLNGAVVLVIAFGLAGISFLIRRRV